MCIWLKYDSSKLVNDASYNVNSVVNVDDAHLSLFVLCMRVWSTTISVHSQVCLLTSLQSCLKCRSVQSILQKAADHLVAALHINVVPAIFTAKCSASEHTLEPRSVAEAAEVGLTLLLLLEHRLGCTTNPGAAFLNARTEPSTTCNK